MRVCSSAVFHLEELTKKVPGTNFKKELGIFGSTLCFHFRDQSLNSNVAGTVFYLAKGLPSKSTVTLGIELPEHF